MKNLEISGFEVLGKLGEGGMATVWKARQLSLDRIVAIKVLSSAYASESGDIARFLDEAKTAAKLKHPGIVQVYDARMEQGVYCFVMEYVAGYTVGNWLRRQVKIPTKDTLLVAQCVAAALDYAWTSEGIIHCDIKPDNVMIDADGTVKVADLGLSRTIGSIGAGTDKEHVYGTPEYMSPEQALGDETLDCRTDIYSLGAMMYHMLTGKRLFAGLGDDEAMNKQISGNVPDPVDEYPRFSPSLAWLLEVMMAKDRDDRPDDWKEVTAELKRAARGAHPARILGEGKASTISRSEKRRPPQGITTVATGVVQSGKRRVVPATAALSAVAAVVAVGLWIVLSGQRGARDVPGAIEDKPLAELPREDVVLQDSKAEESVEPARIAAVRITYETAVQWVAQNPDEYENGIDRLFVAANEGEGTEFRQKALDEIRKVRDRRTAAAEAVFSEIADLARSLADKGDYDAAISALEGYHGVLAGETGGHRASLAGLLKAQRAEKLMEEERGRLRASAGLEQALNQTAESIARGSVYAASKTVSDAVADPEFGFFRAELESLLSDLALADRLDERVLQHFRDNAGREISVTFLTGRKTLRIVAVQGNRVVAEQTVHHGGATATSRTSFSVDDLTPEERIARAGQGDESWLAMVKGVAAMKASDWVSAERHFSNCHGLVAERLTRIVRGMRGDLVDQAARIALTELLQGFGIIEGEYDRAAALSALEEGDFSARASDIRDDTKRYRSAHGGSNFASEAEPVLAALESVRSVERQIEMRRGSELREGREDIPEEMARLVRRLIDGNPMLRAEDINVGVDQGGVVRRLELISGNLVDLSALAGSRELEELAFGPVHPSVMSPHSPDLRCRVSSLEPLRGLGLRYLSIGGAEIRDLNALAGMNLEVLHVKNCNISEIGALKGLPLRELALSNTMIRDIKPIEDMNLRAFWLIGGRVYEFRSVSRLRAETLSLRNTQFRELRLINGERLRSLDISNTRVMDFAPLRGMKLTSLDVSGTQIRELSALAGMELRNLDISRTSITDIRALTGMKLTSLVAAETQIREFAVLHGMPLNRLDIRDSRVEDITFVKGMGLTVLDIAGTRVGDVEALRGLRLNHLSVARTRVRDLSPIAELPLRRLDISSTLVEDLAPIRRMPLETFLCRDVPVKDYTPMIQTPIRSLVISDPERKASVLRAMPRLAEVNHR